MADGLLFVLSEPGAVAEAEFHAWYDDEHGPARIALPGVHTGARLRAADGQAPGWLATYDIDLAVLATPAYRALRERRSDREREIVARLETLDRRVYELIADHGAPAARPGLLVATSLTVAPEAEAELAAWYAEEHVPLLHAIPGWRRTRRLLLREGDAPTHLALHELDDRSPLDARAYREATSTPRRAELMRAVTARERRLFAHHRSF